MKTARNIYNSDSANILTPSYYQIAVWTGERLLINK